MCSILPIVRYLRVGLNSTRLVSYGSGGFHRHTRPALCYEDSSSCCRSRRHFSRNLLALANAATPRRCVVVGPRHYASALLRSAGSVIVGTEACDGEVCNAVEDVVFVGGPRAIVL